MPPLADLVAAILLLALTVYALTGGADFGGGVWSLFASGRRKLAQRRLISDAIGPIWEANHVWLIVVVVVLFVSLPRAFYAISTALHIPLTIMLIGIVLRGAAFIFYTYDPDYLDASNTTAGPGETASDDQPVSAPVWRRVFAIASLLTPIFLGVCLGAVASGALRVDPATGIPNVDFIEAWWTPFSFLVGAFVTTLFAFLAAVYLSVEAHQTGDEELTEDFRRRALASGLLLGMLALATYLNARVSAPLLAAGLASLPMQLLTAFAALVALHALWTRRYVRARVFAIVQGALIVIVMGLAIYPHVIVPDLTFAETLAPDASVKPMLIILSLGMLLLIPSFMLLYRVFKKPSDGET